MKELGEKEKIQRKLKSYLKRAILFVLAIWLGVS